MEFTNKLNEEQENFLEDIGLYENDLFNLSRYMYLIVYNSIRTPNNNKIEVVYTYKDIENFIEEFKNTLNYLEIEKTKNNIENLYNIICDTYIDAAIHKEKQNTSGKVKIPNSKQFGITDIFPKEDINIIPSDILEKIKKDLFKSMKINDN